MPDQKTNPNVDEIPLPDQLPASFDFRNLPKDILHTSTVDTLLNQNQDLMTRLSVNIRRVTDLEVLLRKSEDQIRILENQRDALKEEWEVVSERHRILKTTTEKTEFEKSSIEKRFAELQTKHHEIHERLLEENYYFRGLLFILHNYKRRIKKYVRPLIESKNREIEAANLRTEAAHSRTEEANSRIAQLEKEIDDYELWSMGEIAKLTLGIERFKRYRRRVRAAAKPRLMELSETVKNLEIERINYVNVARSHEKQVSALTEQIKELQMQFDTDQARLVTYHEERFRSIEELHQEKIKKFEELETDLKIYQDRASSLTEENSILENRAIKAERISDELSKKRNADFGEYENKIKELESLIAKQTIEVEDLGMKDSARESLNRRLSQDMTELRKENEQLRLRLKTRTLVQPPPPPVIVQQEIKKAGLPDYGRLERIFAEIQSGHAASDNIPEKFDDFIG